jgi:hypothetical protein
MEKNETLKDLDRFEVSKAFCEPQRQFEVEVL